MTLTKQEIKSRLDRLLSLQDKDEESLEFDKKKVIKHEEDNKLLYFGHPNKGYLGRYGSWQPNPLQQKVFEAWENKDFRIFTMTGGNRIAKTFSLTCMLLCVTFGRWPWEPESRTGWFWEELGWKPPLKIRIVGGDWDKHIKAALIPTFKELWPKSREYTTKTNHAGAESIWIDKITGTKWEIMSNKQETASFEGWSGHIVATDEGMTRDNRIACARGLVDYNGRELYAMTNLNYPWMDDDVFNRLNDDGTPDLSIFNFLGKTHENIGYGISQEGYDNFRKTMNEEEQKVRLFGESNFKNDRVLKINRQKHFTQRFPIPTYFMVDVAIDIGVRRGHDLLYLATSPMGIKYVIYEEEVVGDGTAVAEAIIQRKIKYNLRINRVIADVLAKSDENNEFTVWNKIDIALNRHDMFLESVPKKVNDGIIEINSHLNTVHGTTGLYFFSDLRKCIKQCEGMMFDDNHKPIKNDDDSFENLYRLMLLGTEYENPEDNNQMYSRKKTSSTRNEVTGY